MVFLYVVKGRISKASFLLILGATIGAWEEERRKVLYDMITNHDAHEGKLSSL